jgi:hypothetical protein
MACGANPETCDRPGADGVREALERQDERQPADAM